MRATTHSQVIAAKTLRRNLTQPEIILWAKLRELKSEGLKFRRQQPIGDFVVDFISFDKHLIIEVDGGQHNKPAEKAQDEQRTKWLESQGFSVLRVWNSDVISNVDGVISKILDAIQ